MQKKRILICLAIAAILCPAMALSQQDEAAPGPAAPPSETGSTPVEGETPQGEGAPGGGFTMFIPMILMFVVLYIFLINGPNRKRQKQHQQMMASMQKGDRVRTIGGIIGAVVDVRDDEVVLKIDEGTNTKMRVARNAISKVINDDEQPAAGK